MQSTDKRILGSADFAYDEASSAMWHTRCPQCASPFTAFERIYVGGRGYTWCQVCPSCHARLGTDDQVRAAYVAQREAMRAELGEAGL